MSEVFDSSLAYPLAGVLEAVGFGVIALVTFVVPAVLGEAFCGVGVNDFPSGALFLTRKNGLNVKRIEAICIGFEVSHSSLDKVGPGCRR